MLQLTIVKNDDSVIYYVHIIPDSTTVQYYSTVRNYVVLSSLRTSELNPSLDQKGYLLR